MDLPSPVAIVIPRRPSETEAFAAAELRRYLQRMGAATPSVATEAHAVVGFPVWLGATDASAAHAAALASELMEIQTDSYVIDARPDALVLRGGGDRGTLYAVYDLLEQLGCRWFEPGAANEIVPTPRRLRIQRGTTVRRPVFAVREIGYGGFPPEAVVDVIDWSVKNRLNRIFAYASYRSRDPRVQAAWRRRGGDVCWQHICHNYPWMVPNERYFDTHPEYYSLYRGRRIPLGNEGGNLCTTNSDVRQLVAAYIREWFDRHPHGSAVPMCPPDGAVKWCECDACRALGGVNFAAGPAGRMTRRQVEFVNAVARRLRDAYPQRFIVNLAYSNYVWPYPGMHLEDNVLVQVCHGYAGNGSFVHPITHPLNREARDIFRQWAASGAGGIGIWDYFILQIPNGGGSPLTPLGFGHVAEEMVKFLADLKPRYKVYFTQAGSELWQSNPFLYYALARLVWDPEASLKRLRRDFTRHAFGDGAAAVEKYLALLDRAYDEADDWNPTLWRDITVPSPKVFTPGFVEKGEALLREAAASIDPTARRPGDMLERFRRSLRYARHAVAPKRLVASHDGVWRLRRQADGYVLNAGDRQVDARALARVRREAEADGVLDGSLEKALFRCRSRTETIVWLQNDAMRAGVLPGIGGRLVRLIDLETRRNLLYEPPSPTELTDPGTGYLRYGGEEEYLGKAFASPGWEIPMRVRQRRLRRGGEQSIVLEGTVPGYTLHREILLPPGNAKRLTIRSTVTNGGYRPRELVHRVHPECRVAAALEDTWLFYRRRNDAIVTAPLLEAGAQSTFPVAGSWGCIDPTSAHGLEQRFAADSATVYLHIDHRAGAFNLELFGVARTLQPGESATLEHVYRLLGPADTATKAVLQAAAARPTPRQESPVTPDDGIDGAGIRLTAHGRLACRGLPAACDRAGTFAAWFRLDTAPADTTDAVLVSCGRKDPDWMLLAIRKGKLVAYRRKGRAPFRGPGRAWLKLDGDIAHLEPGRFHHVAWVWSAPENADGIMQLYVDGQSRAARYDAHMLPFTEADAAFVVGANAADHAAPRFPGALDAIRFYDLPLTPAEVRQLYARGADHEAHPPAPAPVRSIDGIDDAPAFGRPLVVDRLPVDARRRRHRALRAAATP